MATSTIRAIAHALPTDVLDHDQLVDRFGAKEMASILKMSGIRRRRIAPKGQCASDLGFAAAGRLLSHHGIDPASIDLLAFVSQTPDYRAPATASVLHGRLGLPERCTVFDVNQACSAFLHGLTIAHSMVVAGTAARALVINADKLSDIIHPGDRSLVSLHGDAAVATVVDAARPGDGGIEHIRICNDGSQFARILVPAGGARCPHGPDTGEGITDDKGITRSPDCLQMDGPAVFHFAVYRVSDFIKEAMADWGLGMDDIDLVLLHQANKTMVEMIYRSVGVPKEKRFINLEDLGNTSGVSLPLALSDALRQGLVKPGSRTLLCGFGAGLSWGMAAIRWPDAIAAATPGDVDVPFVPATATMGAADATL